ncbi:MAG: NAD(P)H-dependent oxidoreductase [Sphingomonadales bacterium]
MSNAAPTKKVFIWVAHPRPQSLCAALADAYQEGLAAQGADVRRLDLASMRFSHAFDGYGAGAPVLEPDLVRWQAALAWADHVMVIHPCWWGAMPTKAKAVLDRALSPGFGYKYHRRGMGWDKLLAGRTADVIITSDTPPIIDTLIYGRSARRVIKNQVLGFCGIKTRRVVQFGSVKLAKPGKIAQWLGQARQMGQRAAA